MNERINRFLGNTPGKTLIHLLVISFVIGIIMSTFGLTPIDVWHNLQDFFVRLYNLGFETIWRMAKYFLWGGIIVVPIFFGVRFLKYLRRSSFD